MTLLFIGAADIQLIMIRCLSVLFHLPLLRVVFPSNVMMIISNMMAIVMFDLLQNPKDIDITSIFEFKDFSQDEIDSKIHGQIQGLGYETFTFAING